MKSARLLPSRDREGAVCQARNPPNQAYVKRTRLFFVTLFALLLAARLCHLDILWAEETLPLAARGQMLRGKVLYRDLWFDKPPLLAWTYLAWGARDGFPLRLAGALYGLLACWVAWRFARDLWGRREAFWAAGLLAFYLILDIPSAVTPLAADLLMLAPHIAAVWLAWRGRAFWSGMLAGVAFMVNPKGVFVLAVCGVAIRCAVVLTSEFSILLPIGHSGGGGSSGATDDSASAGTHPRSYLFRLQLRIPASPERPYGSGTGAEIRSPGGARNGGGPGPREVLRPGKPRYPYVPPRAQDR